MNNSSTSDILHEITLPQLNRYIQGTQLKLECKTCKAPNTGKQPHCILTWWSPSRASCLHTQKVQRGRGLPCPPTIPAILHCINSCFFKTRFSGKLRNKTMHHPAEEKERCLQSELFQDMHRHVKKDLELSTSTKSLNEML